MDINEGNDFGLETVFRSLDYYDEFLAHLWTNLESDLFLELLGDWVLYEPAIEFGFRVLNERTVLILKWQLVSIILAKNSITVELMLTRDAHTYDLLLIADVGQKEC